MLKSHCRGLPNFTWLEVAGKISNQSPVLPPHDNCTQCTEQRGKEALLRFI